MSINSLPKIDQKEYLKRYLSGDKAKKKKKDKKHKKSKEKVKIIDDDVYDVDNGPKIDEELLLTGDDAPQIVGEYAEELQNAARNVPRWKNIVVKEEKEEGDDNPTSGEKEENLWGRIASEMHIKQETSLSRKKGKNFKDNSPPRRRDTKKSSRRSASVVKSPSPRRKREKSDDFSPPTRGKACDKSMSISSPPRRQGNGTPDISPARKGRQSRFSDQSPPTSRRKRPRSRSDDKSPPRKSRQQGNASRWKADNLRGSDRSPARGDRRQSATHTTLRRQKDLTPSPPPRRRGSDQSPPRKNIKSPDQPIFRRSSDQSPPRKSRKSPGQSTFRRGSDQSPPRTNRRSPDQSTGRRSKISGSSSDRNQRDSYKSAPIKSIYKNESDVSHSPHRRPNKSTDLSPPRRGNKPDQSPPRKQNQALDQSPPARRRNSDQSPPRRGRRRSPSDETPPRRRKVSPDQSPPRKVRRSPNRDRKRFPPTTSIKREIKKESLSPSPPLPTQRKSRWEKKSESPPPTHKPKAGKTLDGKTAGLQDAKSLKVETNERRRKEDLLFDKMSSDISGRNAEVKVRSTGRQGRRAREAREEDPEERRQKEEREQKKKEEYERLGKGLKQLEDYKSRKAEMEYESNKPLARYSNDDDLERHLKEQERAEDPMLEYMRKKRKDKETTSGKPKRPEYEGPYPENRFGIRPGHRWDGVDRSNGYEKKWFDVQSAKRATQDEAYKYSVEDM